MEVVKAVRRVLDDEEDGLSLHERLFDAPGIEDLQISSAELGALLQETDADCMRPRSIDLADGKRVILPVGAVDAAPSRDGTKLLIAFDHWVEVRALPRLTLERRVPLGALDGAVDRLSLSPSGRYVALTYTRARGYRLVIWDLTNDALWFDASGHTHPAGPIVFGEGEEVAAFVALNPTWRAAVEKERAAEKPWRADFGSVSIGKIGGLGCSSWALWGALPDAVDGALEPTEHLAAGAPETVSPVFREPRTIDVALPTGEVLSIDYASLFRVLAPNPKEYPAVVRHRVRPREETDAERAVRAERWAPREPFAADWLVPGERVLVVTRRSIAAVSMHDGARLVECAWAPGEGWPTELIVRDDRRLAAVVWHRPATFSSGVELFDLSTDRIRQRFGRGRRFVQWVSRMQPALIGPVAFGPDDQLALAVAEGGFWYDPTKDAVGGQRLVGFVFVHDGRGSSRKLVLRAETELPLDHDQAFDPDRPRRLRWVDAHTLEVELAHGEVTTLRWEPGAPPPAREPSYPHAIAGLREELVDAPSLVDTSTTPTRRATTLVEVTTAGAGSLGFFRVPGTSDIARTAVADFHPSGELVALSFTAAPDDGLFAGVFDTTSGELLFEYPGALAMAWATGRPTRKSTTARDLVIVTANARILWTLPHKQVHLEERRAPPRTVDVSPLGSFGVLSTLDVDTSLVTLSVTALRGREAPLGSPDLKTETGVATSTFSPDGSTWVGFVPADGEPTAEGGGPSLVGELWCVETGPPRLIRTPIRVEPDQVHAASGATVRLDFVGEDDVLLEVGPVVRVLDREALREPEPWALLS
jgi:hypothetical protein